MKRLKRWQVAYLAVLVLLGGPPIVYLALVPRSLDKQLGIGLRSLAFRSEERPVERAAALIAAGAEDEAEALLKPYLSVRGDVGRELYSTGAVCEALAALSGLYEKQGRRKKCLALRKQLVELSPNDYYHRFLLARSFEESGDTAAALENYRESFRLEPGHPELRERYFTLLGELSNSVELVDAYEYSRRLGRRNSPLMNVRYAKALSDLERRALEWTKAGKSSCGARSTTCGRSSPGAGSRFSGRTGNGKRSRTNGARFRGRQAACNTISRSPSPASRGRRAPSLMHIVARAYADRALEVPRELRGEVL